MGVHTGGGAPGHEAPLTSPTVDGPAWLPPVAPRRTPDAVAVPPSPDDTVPGASSDAPIAQPARVAQFVLLERIGAGGMGEVYAAFDDKLERKVAIKLVTTQAGDDRVRHQVLREAQALARLSHPNVVTIYEVDTLPDGGLCIAMELVKGPTLRTWQAQGRTWQAIAATYAEAGRGLAAAHDRGIVHRDFKPDNVLVGDDGRVRVADFGLAFAAEGAMPATPEGDIEGHPEGHIAGTPGYMAPEQLAGTAVDARADQFSFCVALYEALHGERPGSAAGAGRSGARRGAAEPSHPRWLSELLARGLARDPEARFPSMHALLAELSPSRERTRRRVAAASLGALAIAGVAVAALSGRGEPPCPLATAELAGVWDAATRQRSEAAILGTAAPPATRMWTSTAAALDRHAQRWLGAQQAACEATYVRHVQSAALLDRRMACLASRRRALAAAAEVLQRRPAQAIAHAGELLAGLGDLESCADGGALLEPARPAGAATRARADAVRRQLAEASALLAAADADAAESAVAQATRLAGDLDDDVRAELRYLQGRIALARGDVAGAAAELDRAVALAVSSHHDELPADIWLALAGDPATRAQRPADADHGLHEAEAWLRRLGHAGDARWIAIDQARGALQAATGEPGEAVTALSRAIAAAEARWGAEDPRLVPLLRDRAAAAAQRRDTARVVGDGERALALGRAAWGPESPDVARTRFALGVLGVALASADCAPAVCAALERYRAGLGREAQAALTALHMLGGGASRFADRVAEAGRWLAPVPAVIR